MKIACFAVYFGELPAMTQLFIESCARNRIIDFYLIGDCWGTAGESLPENCTIIDLDLEGFGQLSREKLGTTLEHIPPYKICDFRPTFGVLFGEFLEGFDFWATCDIDLVLGDLSSFLSDLDDYDVFSAHKEYICGPLHFMRNCDCMNQLFWRSKDIDLILSFPKHYCFDECAFAWHKLRGGESILEIDTPVESMTEVVIKATQCGDIKAKFCSLSLDPVKNFVGRVEVKGGRITCEGNEYILCHLIFNKARPEFTFPKWKWQDVPNEYFVNRFGVFSQAASFDLMHRIDQFQGKWMRRVRKRFVSSK
jgi:hypothetical protein